MSFITFFKKEVKEAFKTSKAIIIFVVFVFFGILSPVTAKYTNQILASLGGMEGLELPEPTYIDSFMQFIKNNNSICILVLIFVSMGSMVNEKKSGSIYLVLTKGVSRSTVIITKFLSSFLIFVVSYIVAEALMIFYTSQLFGDFDIKKAAFSILCYGIIGVFTLATTIFASTVSKSISGAAIVAVGLYILDITLASIKLINNFIPATLNSLTLEIIQGVKTPSDVVVPLVSTVVLSILFIGLSIKIFEKQEL